VEILLFVLIAIVAYFLSSGIMFVAMYKFPAVPIGRVSGVLYKPLEVIARKFPFFQNLYTGYHSLMYRVFVGDPRS